MDTELLYYLCGVSGMQFIVFCLWQLMTINAGSKFNPLKALCIAIFPFIGGLLFFAISIMDGSKKYKKNWSTGFVKWFFSQKK